MQIINTLTAITCHALCTSIIHFWYFLQTLLISSDIWKIPHPALTFEKLFSDHRFVATTVKKAKSPKHHLNSRCRNFINYTYFKDNTCFLCFVRNARNKKHWPPSLSLGFYTLCHLHSWSEKTIIKDRYLKETTPHTSVQSLLFFCNLNITICLHRCLKT